MKDRFLIRLEATKKELEEIAVQIFSLPPREAIAFLKEKGFVITWDWREQLKLNHSQVFTVAKATRMDILQDIRDMLDKSLENGLTLRDFKKELVPQLQAKGWWGRQVIKGKKVQLGSPWRMKTIYQTNMQSSYNAGRWKAQFDNREDRPYLKIIEIIDAVTRPESHFLNGITKPVDSDFWDTRYPPNHYNDRARVTALNKEELKKEGGVTKGIPQAKDPKTGKIIKAQADKPFRSNPGKDKWFPDKKKFDSDIWRVGQPIAQK